MGSEREQIAISKPLIDELRLCVKGMRSDMGLSMLNAATQMERLEAEILRHETAWNDILALLEDAPEINPSNYDHDQVCLLNSQMLQAWELASEMSGDHLPTERTDNG